jgi:hypothetical protein
MTVMVTTVGYGDSISTPDLPSYKMDYPHQLLFMMIGVLIFRFNQASLTNLINHVLNDEFSSLKIEQQKKEQIESYFKVHNATDGLKFLEYNQLDTWKYAYEQNFKQNYM